MNPGPDAAQWYSNDIAIGALIATVIGLLMNAAIAYLAVTQARAAQASADAAKDSVRAAQQSIEQSKEALEIGNRAWVHVNRIIAHESTGEELIQNRQVTLRPDVILRNFGPTPAVKLIAESRVKVFDGFPAIAELEFTPTDKAGVSIVSPDNEFWVPSAFIALPLDEWNLLAQERKNKIVLFGRADYQDIFGKPHQSTWLYWYDTNVGGFVPGPFANSVT